MIGVNMRSKISIKISIIGYVNILMVLLVAIFHDVIESISEWLLVTLLFVYAILNGVYIQYEIRKQEKLQKALEDERILTSQILSTFPVGVVLTDQANDINYNNPKALEFMQSNMGEISNLKDVEFLSKLDNQIYTNLLQKNELIQINEVEINAENKLSKYYLNLMSMPFKPIGDERKYQKLIVLEDISNEVVLRNKLENQYLEMFKSFAKIIDAKDSYTGMHSTTVVDLVNIILNQLNLDKQIESDTRIAAALHDIGKIGIPELILNKPGKLTDEEYEIMKTHPVIGSELLSGISGYEQISTYIRHHHERPDGNGYPDGLLNDRIPIPSKIISIADAFDAITSKRVYRDARKVKGALEIIENSAGRQFDSELADIFVREIRKKYDSVIN